MNNNNPDYDVYEYETEIADTRMDMFWELQLDGNVMVDGVKLELHDLIDDMDDEVKDNIIAMLFRRTNNPLVEQEPAARMFACEQIHELFESAIPDAIILKHYEDVQSEY